VDRFKVDRQVDSLDGINPVVKVGDFKRRWLRRQRKDSDERRGVPLTPDAEKSVLPLIDTVNESLAAQGIMIHLLLIKDDAGYSLDVYDCTDEKVCSVIKDMVVDLEDLPSLLRNLQEQTGLIVDRVF
jgi:hypothetical protein